MKGLWGNPPNTRDRDAILERTNIAAIAMLAGFRRNRANAWFCGFHENRRTPAASVRGRRIYCWGACQQSWDVFELVMRWQGLNFRGAIRWLADYCCLPKNSGSFTDRERRSYAIRLAAAEREARKLVIWRDGILDSLRDARNTYLAAYHRGMHYIAIRGMEAPRVDFAADDVCELRYLELDEMIMVIERAPWSALLDFHRRNCKADAA